MDVQPLDSAGGDLESLIKSAGAALFGEHEPTLRAAQRPGDAIGREMRLDRQIHPARLEDRQDGRQPIQIALRHHRHHGLAAQPRANNARANRFARAFSSPYVRLRSPHTAATRSGYASTRSSNNS